MNSVIPFMDFEFETENSTLIPRPETEILVEKAVEFLSREDRKNLPCSILDIGTGCGNIAISLTNYVLSSRIAAIDISSDALRVAVKNAAKYGVEDRIEFIKSDLFENLWHRHDLLFDLIISNPPYVSLADFPSLPDSVKDEPYIALYGGRDGADFYRRIINDAHFFLKDGGIMLMEIGYNQAESVSAMLYGAGFFKNIEIYKDYSGINRVVKAIFM